MSCSNPEIGRLLPGFLSGEITPEELALFEEHLLQCDECFKEFQFAIQFEEKIKKHGKSIFLDYRKEKEFEELQLAAAEDKKRKKLPSKLTAHEDIIISFKKADTKIELRGYLSLYKNGELYVNFTDIVSSTDTEKYDETPVKILIPPYNMSSPPLKIKDLKEKLGKYILIGKVGIDKKLDLKSIKKDIRIEPL